MPDYVINSFADLHTLSQDYRKGTWVFRGHAVLGYKLVPKVGRLGSGVKYERRIFEYFTREATAYMNPFPQSEWDLLALAQHHGLPTRLLDWTENPLVAAYFGCSEEYENDGAILMLNTPKVVHSEEDSPFDLETVTRYRPKHITRRIAAQRGLFTVHPDPSEPLVSSHGVQIHRAIIKSEYKHELEWTLSRFGFNRASLFPGLDGLAAHVKWIFTEADPTEAPYAPGT